MLVAVDDVAVAVILSTFVEVPHVATALVAPYKRVVSEATEASVPTPVLADADAALKSPTN